MVPHLVIANFGLSYLRYFFQYFFCALQISNLLSISTTMLRKMFHAHHYGFHFLLKVTIQVLTSFGGVNGSLF